MMEMIVPDFFFVYCGANFYRKRSWQTAEEELQYDNHDELKLRERPHRLTTDLYKKLSAPMMPDHIKSGADFYDHIHDHRHDWSSRRQDATRARKVIFAVAEMSEKR